MAESPEIETITFSDVLDFLESEEASSASMSTRNARNKAIAALRQFVASTQTVDFRATMLQLSDWYADMIFRGLTPKTASYYLDTVAAIYSGICKSYSRPVPDSFSSIKEHLRRFDAAIWRVGITNSHIVRLRSVVANVSRLKSGERLAADIMILSIINGCMPLKRVAMLRVNDSETLSAESDIIIRRNIDARRRYIFPLDQSLFTQRRVEINVEKQVGDFMLSRNLTPSLPASQAIAGLWAYIALSCGYTASDVISALGFTPALLPFLTISRPATLERSSESQSTAINAAVTDALIDNRPQWFAMRLRPGATFEQLQTRLQTIDVAIRPEIFYPNREIARRIGRRLVYRNQPFIADIVFFRMSATDIPELFRNIFDLAWCYRTAPGAAGRYAVIPAHQMQIFQLAIGHFTDAYTVAPIGTLPLRPGDRVEILGGLLSGTTATLSAVTALSTEPDGTTIYRLLFPDSRGIEWRVDLDARLLRRTS